MSLRDWMNNNPATALAAVVALLIVSLAVLVTQLGGTGGGPTPVYFWDLDAGEPFEAPADAMPPVDAPSGGVGVRAHLYTCGECTAEEWFGYLETHSDRARRMYAETGDLPGAPDDLLVRRLDGDEWVALESRAGDAVLDVVYERCESPGPCEP